MNPLGFLTYSPKHFAGPKKWAVEVDYIHKLTPSELAWLIKFQSEYHDGAIRKGDRRALHKGAKLRRECYQRTNLAMRDVFAIKSACNLLVPHEERRMPRESREAEIVEMIDSMAYPSVGLVARAFVILDEMRKRYGSTLKKVPAATQQKQGRRKETV